MGLLHSFEIPDKVAFVLAREADVNLRDSSGNNCLHRVLNYTSKAREKSNDPEYQAELRDILTLMITAGADVYAVNDDGKTVSDIAHGEFAPFQIWADVLETCGYDVDEVSQGDGADYGWSSALDSSFSRYPARPTSKLSFAEYLEQREEQRKASARVEEIIDEENVEEEWVREERIRYRVNEGSFDSDFGRGLEIDEKIDWGSDSDEEESSEEEEDDEEQWITDEDQDGTIEQEANEDICNDEIKWD